MGRHITRITDDKCESAFLFQCMSMVIQRYNAVAIQGTFNNLLITVNNNNNNNIHISIQSWVIISEAVLFEIFVCFFDYWTDSADYGPIEPIPEYIPNNERENSNKWHTVQISDRTYRIDMESIDQYKKVLSHGGESCCIIVFIISMVAKQLSILITLVCIIQKINCTWITHFLFIIWPHAGSGICVFC